MVVIEPFRAVRPTQQFVKGVQNSLVLFDSDSSKLQGIREKYKKYKEENVLVQDDTQSIYIYRQTNSLTGKTYIGLIANASIDDYINGNIKIHEKTLLQREIKFRNSLNVCNFSTEPVLVTYPDSDDINTLIAGYMKQAADFESSISKDSISHTLWVVNKLEHLELIKNVFQSHKSIYIADGHHRSASSVFVGESWRKQAINHSGAEPFNYFMCLFIPFSELEIFGMHRVVKDLNGLSKDKFLELLSGDFYVDNCSSCRTPNTCSFEMYLDGAWYYLTCKEEIYNSTHPVKSLETYVLSKRIFLSILSVVEGLEQQTVQYVGGHHGKDYLESLVDSGSAVCAFYLPSITMNQLQAIADAGESTPPKSTWIEPKLPNGLTIFEFSNAEN